MKIYELTNSVSLQSILVISSNCSRLNVVEVLRHIYALNLILIDFCCELRFTLHVCHPTVFIGNLAHLNFPSIFSNFNSITIFNVSLLNSHNLILLSLLILFDFRLLNRAKENCFLTELLCKLSLFLLCS